MKYFVVQDVFQYTWEQVVCGFWKRYPNPNSRHIMSEDVLDRKLVGNKLITKRLITKKGSIPKWGEKFIKGCSKAYVVEESIVDMANSTFTTYTRNVNLKDISTVDEKCVYTADRLHTTLTRQGWVASFRRFSANMIEQFTFHKFKSSTAKSAEGFKLVLGKLYHHETEHPSRAEKLKNSAKIAKDIAKSKVFHTSTCDGNAR
ncbi:PRELI domain-containing protein 1, mitochondrial-like [Dreissena polymorpha]|uniref:PRELI/MSF1 domain-containing protein n=2 Tax=Dreissena polymorpha TaxID=45954 RepID=A0A9D4EVT6_DREPO|nr:PRELI domain-containing protein 1, mitochondrial-like isoform X2 [Dreissena polymorpha]XP_052225934.1 PRELI domain-containing protein 1, mitochondrial-like [Dreissena polymorpha]KAH3787157.1 hypothetical protein DPMN_165277 [Dreissena polymorpha]KAH3787167.1 hypothetical protein DPMN_165287 [Dreissena polymorpha]